MATLSFYIGNPEDYFQDENDKSLRDIHSIRVQESSSLKTGYETIQIVKFQHGEKYVETQYASDDYVNRYYRLEFISDPNEPDPTKIRVFLTTEPMLPEILADIVDRMREWLGDTDIEDPAYEDSEYLSHIRFAFRQWRGDKNIGKIQEEDMVPLQLLIKEAIALDIAHDHGKYYELSTPTHKLNKWEIGQHYLSVAEGLREQFKAYSIRLNMGSGGYDDDYIINEMPAPKVATMKRYSRTQGHYVTGKEGTAYRRKFFMDPHRDEL